MNRSEEIRDFLGKDALSGSVHESGRTPRPLQEPRTLVEPSSI